MLIDPFVIVATQAPLRNRSESTTPSAPVQEADKDEEEVRRRGRSRCDGCGVNGGDEKEVLNREKHEDREENQESFLIMLILVAWTSVLITWLTTARQVPAAVAGAKKPEFPTGAPAPTPSLEMAPSVPHEEMKEQVRGRAVSEG
jgi:hypothetical protein